MKQLPSRANLEHLRKQAKTLKKVEGIPKLCEAQYRLAQSYGFTSWTKLLHEVQYRSPLARALADIKVGKGCILLDSEDRENEGDFIFSAEHINAEKINFMLQFGRGTICASFSYQLGQRIGLLKDKNFFAKDQTPPFADSLDFKDCHSGVSAADRALTVKELIGGDPIEGRFRNPGHLHTLVARPEGLKERQGHTEGSVSIMKMANLVPCAVICEIMNEDGSMARPNDLVAVAKKFDMSIVHIKDLRNF